LEFTEKAYMPELSKNITPWLTTSGTKVLGILIALILENQYRIDDAIEVAGVSGLDESVSLRRTVLRDLEGNVHTISNRELRL
jgi:hypothetical protein